jgi:hypothetical protein
MPEVAENQTDDSTALIQEIKSVQRILSSEHYQRVVNQRGLLKDMIKDHESRANPRIEEAKNHLKNLRDDLGKLIDPLGEEYKRLGTLLGNWDTEKEREKRRKELEIEAADRAAKEKEKQELAALAKQMGDKQLVKEILGAPIEPSNTVVTKDVPTFKDTGVSFREDWVNFELEDLKKVPMEYHLLNEVAVRKVVRALKSATKIPGIKVLPPNKITTQRG